jgi:hypothetical protein
MPRAFLPLALSAILTVGSASAGPTIGLPRIPILDPLLRLTGLELPTGVTLPDVPGLPDLSGVKLPEIPKSVTLPQVTTTVPVPGQETRDAPDYTFAKNVHSLPDYRLEKLTEAKLPFLETVNLERLKNYEQNREACRKAELEGKAYTNPDDCPQYEYALPFSMLEDSQESARALRKAWQRFEDRYYWRAMTELNNPAYYIAFCYISWGGGPNPARPDVKISVPRANVPKQFDAKLEYPEPDPQFHLDDYIPLPKVPKEDYCDELNLEFLPFMYIPGFCISLFGQKIICTEDLGLTDPNASSSGTDPIWFNYDEAVRRVLRAIKRAHSTYLAQYQEDALNALLPRDEHKLLFMTPWGSQVPDDGAFVSPVMNLDVDPSQFVRLAQTATDKLEGVEALNAFAYYFQDIVRSPSLNLNLLPGRTDRVGTPPGLWRLEELKRWLSPSSLPYYERLGYTSFYQAWNQLDATVLPEPLLAKALRPIMYFAVGVNLDINFTGISASASLSPIPVAPYLLPFAGPRMYSSWVSVPEGYDIPRVKNAPLFDYRPIIAPK